MFCKQCNSKLSKDQPKFCSRSCAGKFNTAVRYKSGWRLSESSKKQISLKAKTNRSGVTSLSYIEKYILQHVRFVRNQ